MASHLFANLTTPSVPVIGGGLVFVVALDLAFRYWKLLKSIEYVFFFANDVRKFLAYTRLQIPSRPP